MMTDLEHYKSRLYYSQNREDLILKAFFPDVRNGFYVDVGGYDPDVESVTKLFYLEGWHGINIEPIPERCALFEKRRKRDTNINMGVSDVKGVLTLRSYANQGLSTFSQSMIDSYAASPDVNTAEHTDIKVQVQPLKTILKKAKAPAHIHFLKIDVEGFEYKVLAGNDWTAYRPEVLCLEANHPQGAAAAWQGLLEEKGYEFVFSDGLNEYYADRSTNRKAIFDYVNYIVIARGGGLRYDDFLAIKEGVTAREHLRHVVDEAAVELQRKADRIARQEAEWSSIRAVTHRLAGLLWRSVTGKRNRNE